MTAIEQEETRTEKPQEEFSGGYLLFDRKALHVKEWIAFRQEPKYVSLEDRIKELDEQQELIPRSTRLREQEVLKEIHTMSEDLGAARSKAREAGAALRGISPKAILYRVASVIAPFLAERINPYETSRLMVEHIKDQRKSAETQRRVIKRESEMEKGSLDREKTLLSTELRDFVQSWLFSTPERTLFHALTFLSRDINARGEFLLQYSQRAGLDFNDVAAMYDELAAKAAPSLHARSANLIVGEFPT